MAQLHSHPAAAVELPPRNAGTNSLDACCLATGGKRLFVSIDDAAAVYIKKKKKCTRSFNGRAVSAQFRLVVAFAPKLREPSMLSSRLVPQTTS